MANPPDTPPSSDIKGAPRVPNRRADADPKDEERQLDLEQRESKARPKPSRP